MYTTKSNLKKITVTVNGEPVGNGLLLDSVTFRPVNDDVAAVEAEHDVTTKR